MQRRRQGVVTNGVALILVILIIAIPSGAYLAYFNKPLTIQPSTSSSSGSTGGNTTQSSGPEPGFITGGLKCGFGLLYGSPGGQGCIIYVLNNGTLTATPTGMCELTFKNTTYAGTFSFADQLAPKASTGRATCGATQETPDALTGTVITGEVFLSNGAYVPFNSTSIN